MFNYPHALYNIKNFQDSLSPMGILICSPSLSIWSIELDSLQNIVEKYNLPFLIDERKFDYQKYPTILNLQDSFSPMGISICTPSLSIRSIELDSIQNIIEKYKQPFFIDEGKSNQFNFQFTCIMYTSG